MKIRTMSARATCFVTLLLCALLVTAPACSRKKEENAAVVPQSKDITAELAEHAALLQRIPVASDGFFYWNTSHAAYKRLLESPWAGTDYIPIEESLDASTPIGQALRSSGFDMSSRRDWEKTFSEGIFFTSPGPQGEPSLSVAIRSAADAAVPAKLDKLKDELKKIGVPVQELEVPKGSGFSFDAAKLNRTPQAGAEQGSFHVHVGWDGNLAVISSAPAVVSSVLSGTTALPTLVTTAEFKERTSGFPDAQSRYGIGYFDLASLFKALRNTTPAATNAVRDPEKIPFRAVSWALAMGEAPFHDVRVAYKAMDPQQQQWFQTLGESQADNIVSVMPANPLFFLSLDGPTVKRVKELAVAEFPQGAPPAVAKQLAALDTLKRVGILARIAPVGQSILPMPDLTIMFETSDTAATSSALMDAVGMASQGAGMPGSGWQEKTVANTPVKAMISPLGFGAFVASSGNFVILSSSENQLATVLDATQGKGQVLAKSLPPQAKKLLANEETLGNVYVDFVELGTFMENMTGLLAMYAPQNEEAKKLMDPKNIEEMKKMGSMVGAITLSEGSINFRSFYQAHEATEKEVAASDSTGANG